MTHEVRNALVPVRHHLDALSGSSSESTLLRVEAARRGVVRVLDFVEQLVATAELVAEPATSCDLADIISESLGRIEDSERVTRLAPCEPVQRDPTWMHEGPYLACECKNWSSPCGAGEFRAFHGKLLTKNDRLRTGFFIAPGASPGRSAKRAAHIPPNAC